MPSVSRHGSGRAGGSFSCRPSGATVATPAPPCCCLPKSREQPLLPFLPGSRSEPPPPPFVSRQAEPPRRTWDVFAHSGGVAQCLSAAVQAAKAVLAVIRPGLLRLGRFKSRCDLKFLCLHMYMALSGKGLLSEGQRPWADCEGLAAYFIRADPPPLPPIQTSSLARRTPATKFNPKSIRHITILGFRNREARCVLTTNQFSLLLTLGLQ